MLSDKEWAELDELHLSDPQPVEYLELDVRADAAAIERLPCMLGKIFKYTRRIGLPWSCKIKMY